MIYVSAVRSKILLEIFDMLNFSNGDFLPNIFEFFIVESNVSAPNAFAA